MDKGTKQQTKASLALGLGGLVAAIVATGGGEGLLMGLLLIGGIVSTLAVPVVALGAVWVVVRVVANAWKGGF